MLDAAVLIPRPTTERALADLGMRCSEKEIPDPLAQWTGVQNRHAMPDVWWLAAGCFFEGGASPLNAYGELAAAEHVTAGTATGLSLPSAAVLTQLQATTSCTAAFCIADGRLLAIVSPNDAAEAAIWVAMTCSDVVVEPRGSQGLRGRPKEIGLSAHGWKMELIEVSRLYRRWDQKGFKRGTIEERVQTGQEASLVAALADASKVTPSQQVEQPPVDAPSAGEGYVWVRQDALGGLFRLIRQGQSTTATSLVDRELPVADQVSALEAIDWMPTTVLSPIIKATREEITGKLWVPDLPEGRVSSPFSNAWLQLFLDAESTHPVHRYFWPSFTSIGDLCLDLDEAISHSWVPSASLISSHKPTEADGIGTVGKPPQVLDLQAYLTTTRLVSNARRDPSKVEQGDGRLWCSSHFRWEWIYEMGTVRITNFKRTGILAKKVAVEETEGLYARLHLTSGMILEIRFPEAMDRSGALGDLLDRCLQLIAASSAKRQVQPETQSTKELTFATVVRTAVPISGAVPYSLPERVSPVCVAAQSGRAHRVSSI
jgi:hypothetical protein